MKKSGCCWLSGKDRAETLFRRAMSNMKNDPPRNVPYLRGSDRGGEAKMTK